ncbi:MAG TPA: hypothetical protein VLW55_03735 [Burkholderiaceae bacterium]|nr:hypothetical protein [Burkholderiaceae bacterium]
MWKRLFLAAGALATTVLAACVAVPVEEHHRYAYDHDHYYHNHRDRDHDGVPDRRDRAPENPYRY